MKEFNLFINRLVFMDKKERHSYLMMFKHDGKKIIFDSVEKLTDVLNLKEIDSYAEQVRKKYDYIRSNPGRHWDYVAYQTPDGFCVFNDILVSTDGHILKSHKSGRVSLLYFSDNYSDKYHRFSYKDKSLRTHRAVAYTFLPVPKRLKGALLKDLDVSFIDADDLSHMNSLNNLEWLYGNEKQRKAAGHHHYTEKEYFLFEVLIDNGFKGTQFVLNSKQVKILGLKARNLRKCINGDFNTMHGMKVTPVQTPAGYNLIPKELLELFNKDPRYFDASVKPIIGEVLEGKHRGLKFSLFGCNDFANIFASSHIRQLTNKRKEIFYRGCRFRRATHREAIPYHGYITPVIAKELKPLKDVKK